MYNHVIEILVETFDSFIKISLYTKSKLGQLL